MKCKHCGADIPRDMMICPDCATEVQIVPDYNPLDDVLTREVKGQVKDATRPMNTEQVQQYQEKFSSSGITGATRTLNQEELNHLRSGRGQRGEYPYDRYERSQVNNRRERSGERLSAGNSKKTTGNIKERQRTGQIYREYDDKKNSNRIPGNKRKKGGAKKFIIFLALLCILLITSVFFMYQNSYQGMVNRGYKALQSGEYKRAENYFNRAISKDAGKGEAYTGLAEVYLEEEDLEQAEDVFLRAITSRPSSVEICKAAIQFYVDTEQQDKISEFLAGCNESVLEEVSEYVSPAPVFGLEENTYSEVQEVALEADGDIYYTIDGTEPTVNSIFYEEPVLLNEGVTTIRAIAVNKQGIVSTTVSATYIIEIPIADAPAVTPSTGQYSTPTQITIAVPEGYTAYYTMNGDMPTVASSVYTGPIDMPEGTTIFSAVLVNSSGKMTQVTRRNYVLEY